ncbi:hypothetical protein Kpol_1050p111 [Vanderwaltozyma polyspora DSM 70294]|uniref:EF-hand domain-containing protein n=1 Tax=Vanderwaltozyma polyspora (strain ATCC 22028 / DSM 70294 / BCRC 21397 / CBS 2163 / NBRC 10782 / NRRL Y-8283 / UCD 57-17) TaxID=436907 RepID=A7TF05_VANPO|nr:uncharacterized protein Kpol_1050p111 [Vanderwaltozyma polyspora DSM 70294]EDO19251.1 hypothetical protein Kpol_1050p111 [Vanderwaltozyma polyspora DSM 70294]
MDSSTSVNFNVLSSELIDRLKVAFQMIDDDGDGSITKEDLKKTFKTLGVTIGENELDGMLNSGGVGEEVSFPEFLRVMSGSFEQFSSKKELEDSFKNISSESDGNVSQQELTMHLKEAGFQDAESQFSEITKHYGGGDKKNGKFKSELFLNSIGNE